MLDQYIHNFQLGSEAVKQKILKLEGIEVVLDAMKSHCEVKYVQHWGCDVLWNLSSLGFIDYISSVIDLDSFKEKILSLDGKSIIENAVKVCEASQLGSESRLKLLIQVNSYYFDFDFISNLFGCILRSLNR